MLPFRRVALPATTGETIARWTRCPAGRSSSATRAPAAPTRSSRPAGTPSRALAAARRRPAAFATRTRSSPSSALGSSRLSTQDSAYQREMAERLHLPFPVLSDERLELTRELGLPTFETSGWTLLQATHPGDRRREDPSTSSIPSSRPTATPRRCWTGCAQRLSGALADSEQSVFWLDSPAAPRAASAARGRDAAATWRSSAAASPACGRRCWRRPTRAWCWSRAIAAAGARAAETAAFVEASLSHGLENGLSRWPDEIDTLVRLGRENFAAIRETLDGARHRRRLG